MQQTFNNSHSPQKNASIQNCFAGQSVKGIGRFFMVWVVSAVFLLTACDFSIDRSLPLPTLAAQPPAFSTTPLPTSAALTPTPFSLQTAVPPLPTATYDPKLADWTVLIYMNGDNNLERAALLDLQEMELAGSSKQVNVLVQVDRAVAETAEFDDWTDTRRYLILGDADTTLLTSQPIASLGEQNMGDPAVLADFLTWGIRTYPANRYALILWDHGAGWNGISFDSDGATYGQPDFLSLADVAGGLAQALAQTNLPHLDVLAFDACLMGQLDVFQAIQPFARYAVASEELTPGQGFDYTAVLGHLYANSQMDGAALANQMVTDFVTQYTQNSRNDFVTLSAVDLTRLPTLTQAVEQLANTLMPLTADTASAVGDARTSAQAYAQVYADGSERYGAIDLSHFAAILAQRSPNSAVQTAAQQVVQQVNQTVLANGSGSGLKNSHGIAIYFPPTAASYTPGYERITGLKTWNAFLSNYHITSLDNLPLPEVILTQVLQTQVGLQNPAYLEFQIVGRDITEVWLLGGRYEENGRRRLLEYDRLIPEPTYLPDGNQLTEWRDGVHQDFFIWDTRVTYLSDTAGNGDFVVMWPTEPGSTLFTVRGLFRRANSGSYTPAHLVFDHFTGSLTAVWSVQASDNTAAAQIIPEPGDEFQMSHLYLLESGDITAEPGPSLFFDTNRQLYFSWAPLPDGDHFLGFRAVNVAGKTAESLTDLTIQNTTLLPGYTAYLDPYLGFQFLYPESWYRPTYQDGLLYTTSPDTTTQLQITLYPNLTADITANTLKTQTLAQFGGVDTLFEDNFTVAGTLGQRTAYGYIKPDGTPHTGIFAVFIQGNTGYVVDLDGSQLNEAATVETMSTLLQSWQFLPAGIGLQPGKWAQLDFETFSVAQPTDFVPQPLNGWQRFIAGPQTFVALRTQPATSQTTDVLAALLRDAANGIPSFTTDPSRLLYLGGATWDRADFRYTAADGQEIWGYIMVKQEAGQEVVAWVEAPATTYNNLETNVFLTMIADLAPHP